MAVFSLEKTQILLEKGRFFPSGGQFFSSEVHFSLDKGLGFVIITLWINKKLAHNLLRREIHGQEEDDQKGH